MQQRQVQTVDGVARRVGAQPQPEDTPVTSLARRSTNYVAAAPQTAPVTQPAPMEGFNVPTPSQAVTELRTTYLDRSKGFVWAIAPVAIITGVLSCVAGVVLFSVPVLSWALLQTFLAFFCLTWIIGYALHTFVSPDGALFLNTIMLWRTVQREQQDRHKRYWTSYQDSRRDNQP